MPHAPASRRVQEDPIAVVERLLADESSQVRGDEEWDFYAQIEDEVAVTRLVSPGLTACRRHKVGKSP